MKPCISEVTTLPGSFAEDVANYAGAGFSAMEVWLTKLETHLQEHSAAQTRQLLKERGMALSAAAYQGGLLLSQGEARKTHFDHFRRRLEICQEIGIPVMLIIADFSTAVQEVDLPRAVASLTEAAQWAEAFNVRLALEFRGKDTFCTCLDTALSLIAEAQHPHLGINFDVFHYYTGPSKFEDLTFLSVENLFHVQLCDLAGVPRELASDADRVLPGDGDFQLEPLIAHLRKIGYEGYVSLELMNPTIWKANPKQVAEIAITALRKTLGQAESR